MKKVKTVAAYIILGLNWLTRWDAWDNLVERARKHLAPH